MALRINEDLTRALDAMTCQVTVDGDSLMDFEDRKAVDMALKRASQLGWTGPTVGLREQPRPYAVNAANNQPLVLESDETGKAAAAVKVSCFRAEFRFNAGAGV